VVVDMAPVDSLVGQRDVSFIHLDVEGHELAALEGARRTIERCKPYLYVEADRPDMREKIWTALDLLGYEALYHEAPLYNRDNFEGNALNVFGNTVSLSYLGIPRGAA